MIAHALDYPDGDALCEAWVAHEAPPEERRPCVLVAHQWSGQQDHERSEAEAFARLGHVGFALDVYGKGVRGDLLGDNAHLMDPWMADRAALRRRLLAAVAAARAHPAVDPERIAAVGWCFGGLCALDLARIGAAGLRGVVSIHGVLAPPGLGAQPPIAASVLALHGWEDPFAPPDAALGLAAELTAAGADWQIHAYGHALHAFTAEGVDLPERGLRHDPKAARRAREATLGFLREIFA